MYKRILVPLDGSELAECVFPHMEAIAGGCSVPEVVFLRVVEPFTMPTGGEAVISAEMASQLEEQANDEAKTYLERVKGRLKIGSAIKTAMLHGRAAETIADYAAKNEIDLIIIATHGRSGVSRWLLGSVADRVVRSTCVPVLMVLAPGCVPGI